jgi:four helix bundle protein
MTQAQQPQPSSTAAGPASAVAAITAADELVPTLDANKLDVYNVAVQFQVLAAGLVPREHAVLRDQLERASVSIVLNVAEGCGRRTRHDKARFFSMARGSAMESAAVLDLLQARSLIL